MRLVTDSDEKAPLVFSPVEGVTYERKKLRTGDYAAWYGDVQAPALCERKSVADLYNSFSANYDAERAKILRAKELNLKYILAIEASATEIRKGHGYWKDSVYHEHKKPGISMIRQLMSVSVHYGVDVWFCSSREEMAWRIQEYFLAWERMHEKALVTA